MTDIAPVVVCSNHPDITEGVRRCARCMRAFCADCYVLIGGQPYCATCKSEQVLDVRSGVDAGLSIASLGRRFGGAFIDGLPWAIISSVIVFRAIIAGTAVAMDSKFILLGFTSVIYDGLMMQLRSQTVGKMAMHTKVVRIDGSRITTGQAWLRAITRWVLAFLYFVDWVTILFTRERLCVHDMVARTRVINTD
jgi:uncharacterized RDD family membrane protein YckC